MGCNNGYLDPMCLRFLQRLARDRPRWQRRWEHRRRKFSPDGSTKIDGPRSLRSDGYELYDLRGEGCSEGGFGGCDAWAGRKVGRGEIFPRDGVVDHHNGTHNSGGCLGSVRHERIIRDGHLQLLSEDQMPVTMAELRFLCQCVGRCYGSQRGGAPINGSANPSNCIRGVGHE